MDCSPPGSSVCDISQASILQWIAILFWRSSQFRDQTHIFCTGRQILYHWATREDRLNTYINIIFSSVQFSHSVVSGSLRPHEPSTPGLPVHRQLTEFIQTHVIELQSHPTTSFSVVPFSSCPQSFPASGSFQVSQHFASGGQSIGLSAWASVLPMNTQDWSPLGWMGWISLQSKGLSRVFSNTTVQKCQLFSDQFSL